MAVSKKYLQKQDLSSIETFVIDNRPESIYFNVIDVEETIPGGKSTFQILGSKFLTPEVELKIELIDRNGNPIYIEPIKYLGDKPSRHVSVEIYNDTPTGLATLTILGSADSLSDGSEIPDEWKGLYNVKWERSVFIDPTLKNTEPILFRGQAVEFFDGDKYPLPQIEVIEKVRGIVVPSGSGASETGFVTQSSFTGGNYEANASQFDYPLDIKDAETENKFGVPFKKTSSPYEVSPTAYGVQKDNLTDGIEREIGFDDEILSDDDFYEDHHSTFPKINDVIPKQDDDEVNTQPDPPTPTLEPDFAGEGTLIKKTSGADFRSELAGGTFTAVPSVDFNSVKNVKGHTFTSSSFTASIVAVHSPDIIEIDRPFTIANQTEFPDKNFKVPHSANSFKIEFRPAGQTQDNDTSVSETIFKSFAEITVKNMKTFSGDVHRVKTFVKGYGDAASGFQLVSDKIVEASDVLTNRDSPTFRQKIGVFESQTRVHKNWTLRQHNYGAIRNYSEGDYPVGDQDDGVQATGSFQFGDTSTPPMMAGVHISGSNQLNAKAIVFETNLSNLKVRPNVQYELKLRPILKVGQKFSDIENSKLVSQARVRFFISGSKINQNLKDFEKPQGSSLLNNTYPVGNMDSLGDPIRNLKGVVSLESPASANVGELLDFGVIRIPFTPEFEADVVTNTDTKLQIVVEAGELFLGRVELIPATDTSFNPDEFTYVAPMPKLTTRPDFFDIAIQFFDRNSNKAQFVPIKQAVKFEGQNEVIQGDNNLLTGSLFIGNALLSGIEAGGINSAFIRSVGYVGFTSASLQGSGGFMMFSGSVLPDSPDSYQGVGLEIHDGNSGSFKFRTHNEDGVGEFDVRTNKFFLGKVGEQFVSGSDGNLEISSSGFHLQTDGKVTASQIHIDGGFIGGSLVIDESVTVDAATANQIRVPVGGPPFKAEILSDGYARFSTGSIASFNIDSNALFTTGSNSFYISGSAAGIPTQNGKQNNFISASKFQVSADGNLTASNVLIDGGVITSDVTVQGTFSANSILTPAGSTVDNAKASITEEGAARFTSASIAGFRVSETSISSSNGSLILRDNGRITGSFVNFLGGTIGGFGLSDTTVSSSNAKLVMKSSGQITGSSVQFTGGDIGGWTIASSTLIGGNVTLNSAGSIKVGSVANATTTATTNAGFFADNSGNVLIKGNTNNNNYIKVAGGGGIDIKSTTFDLDATTLILDSGGDSGNGVIRLGGSGGPDSPTSNTAGIYMDGGGAFNAVGDSDNLVRFDAGALTIKAETFDLATSTMILDSGTNSGKIALGATPNSNISGTNKGVYIDGTGDFLLFGNTDNLIKFDASANSITMKSDTFDLATSTLVIDSGTNSGKIALGATPNTSVAGTNTGIYMDGTGDFLVRGDANNFLKINIGGSPVFDFKAQTFRLDTDNLDVNSALRRLTIDNGSNSIVLLGEIDGDGSSLPGSQVYGLKIFDGTGTADSDILVELGTSENKIAGWTIGNDTISSGNLIINSSGRIETSNFASGQKGWRIDSLQNGRAEFENVKIRGTLSTTVFEKETVNAVGGQLYVANSSTITSSAHHPQGTVSASNATMSLVNVSGFATDEILAIKKVSNTGFSTEYVQVISSSRFSGSSDTNLSGLLFVTRSYGGGIDETGTGLSSSLGDPAFLTAQQYEDGQVVVSTGKLLGGTGQNTTGSGFIRINANPNDLSTPFIDIVERTGSAIYDVDVKARLGDLSGLSSQFVRGADVKGFGLVTSNVFLTSSFFVGGVNEHLSFETGSFEAKLKNLNLSTNQGLTIIGEGSGSANKILLGLASNFSSGDGIFMDGGGDFRVGGESSNFIKFDASTGVLTVDGTINITGGGGINESISGLQATLSASNAQSSSFVNSIAQGAEASASLLSQGAFQSSSLGANASHSLVIDMASGSLTGSAKADIGLTDAGFTAKDIIGSNLGSGAVNGTTGLVLTSTFLGYKESGSPTSDSSWPVFIKNNGNFKFGEDENNKIAYDGTTLDVDVAQIDINSGGLRLIGTANAASSSNQIRLGSATAKHTGNGIFMAGNSVFRIGGTTSNYMSFESGSLEVVGKITISNPGDIDISELDNSTSGFTNDDTANAANTAASNAQSTANTANTAAGNAQSTANTANTAASNAQSAVDTIEEKVVITGQAVQVQNSTADKTIIDSGIVSIVQGNVTSSLFTSTNTEIRGGTLASKTTASFDKAGVRFIDAGVTQSLFGANLTQIGVTTGSHIQMSGSGLELLNGSTTRFGADSTGVNIGDPANEHVRITDSGVDLKDGLTTFGRFAATTTIGRTDQEHVSIGTSGVDIKDGSTVLSTFGTDAIIGEVGSNKRNVKIDADAGILIRNNTTNLANFDTDITLGEVGSNKRNVFIDASSGVNIRNNTTNIASFGEDAIIGEVGSNKRNVKIDADAGILIRTNETNLANFDTDITLGEVGSNKRNVFIDADSGVKIRNNTTDIASFGSDVTLTGGTFTINDGTRDRLVINSSDITMTDEAGAQAFNVDTGVVQIGDGSSDYVEIDSTGIDMFRDGTSQIRLTDGQLILAPDVTAATTDAVVIAAGGVKIFDSATDFLHMGSDGLKVFDGDASNPVAQFGTTTFVGKEATEHIKITNSSLEIIDGATSTTFASFGSTTKIGDANNEHVEINSSTIDVKDGVTTHASFGSTSTIGSATDKVTIDSDGVTIREANVDTIQLANSTASFGNASAQHVQIVGDGVHLKKDANTRVGTFGKVIDVNDETTRGFTNVTSASVNLGRFATPTFNEVSIEGISASNAIFDRVFTSNINSSNLQSTGSISLFTSRSLSATTTSSVPFVVHDEVSSTDALIEPSFQFSTLYTAKGADAIGFPSVSSGSATGIFDISTTITSDGQNASPFKGQAGGGTSQAFNVLGLRVMNDTGDNTGGGGRFQFKGALDSQPYTFINAVDKSRVPPAFRNLGGIRFQVKNSGAIVSLGDITAFGNTSNFTTLSDIKYKKDITRISESLDRVLELKPSKFVWKTTDTEDIGFIAQEVEDIIPEVVLTDKEGIMGAPETKGYKTITYPKLIPLLVDSIQELTKKVSTLENKIKKLEK